MIKAFDYHQPSTLQDAVELLARYGSQARIIAGGSTLLVEMQHGSESAHLIGLENIPSLNTLSENGTLHIGALTTLTDLAAFAVQRPALQALVEAIRLLGGRQIQNVATLGGNICYASPGADMMPALLCLDAQLRLFSPSGERVIPLDGFVTAPHQTALLPAEIVTAVELPPLSARTATASKKLMRRQSKDVSIAAAAARVTLSDDGQRCADVRIAACSVAPTPIRLRAAESVLSGAVLTPAQIKAAARAAAEEAQPVSDLRASADYRRLVLETLVERVVTLAGERALSVT